nr:unnamed protein product [Callosobruchus analis]
MHFNIRGLNKHFDELLLYLETGKEFLDIIILSETRNIDDINKFQIPNYTGYYNESIRNICDGTVIYVKDTISPAVNIVQINTSKFLRINFNIEYLNHRNKIGLTGYYRPPSFNTLEYLGDLEQYLQQVDLVDLEIFSGDMNIDLLNDESSETNSYLDILSSYGFASYINKATRVTTTSKSDTDHIFVRKKSIIEDKVDIDPIVFHTDLSDHYSPFIFIAFGENLKRGQIENVNCFKVIEYNKLVNQLRRERWVEVLKCNDSQEAYNIFFNGLDAYIQRCTKMKVITKKNRKLKPWISSGLITSIHKRDILKKKLTKHFNPDLHIEYKEYRNKLQMLIKKAKSTYYKSQIDVARGNCKKIWDTVNDLRGNKNKTVQVKNIDINGKEGQVVSNSVEKANLFNEYFLNIGIDHQTNKQDLPVHFMMDNCTESSIFLEPTTESELVVYISNLKNKCSSGPDGVSTELIKQIHNFILRPLVHIINLSLTSSKIPIQWKESIVTPVFKSGDKAKLTNYRPISVINNFAKLFEQVIKKRLNAFLEKHKIITESQFGFTKNQSTEDAILKLMEPIVDALDKSKKCAAVFLDLAKAFDTICHQKLLVKLSNYGIRGVALNLLQDYLTDRVQCVKIGDKVSSKNIIKAGVPQGTVLGPILFLIYMNSITNIMNFEGKLICYADDTAVVVIGSDWEEVRKSLEACLVKLKQWLDANSLKLNVSKTKYMFFSPTVANQPNMSIRLHTSSCKRSYCNCEILQKEATIKYLGINIDQRIRWIDHINYVNKRVRVLISKFYSLRDICSRKVLIMMYNALVVSVLKYCITIWGGAFTTTLQNLQRAQNTLIKIIFNKHKLFSTDLLYKETKFLRIKFIYVYQCLTKMYLRQKSFKKLSTVSRAATNLNLSIDIFKKTLTQKTFFYHGPKFFNLLPADLKRVNKFKEFKYKVKEFITENQDKFSS